MRTAAKKHRNDYLREWCKRNPEKRFMRYFRHRLKKRYGMTPDDFFEAAADFDNKCFICERELILPCPKKRIRNGRSAVVDHDHEHNIVRGILCNDCNRAIGMIGSLRALRRACIYIEAFNIVELGKRRTDE